MQLKNLIKSLILLLLSVQSIAQETTVSIHKADSLFKVGDYSSAVNEYSILKKQISNKDIDYKLIEASKAQLLKNLSVKNAKKDHLAYIFSLLEIVELNPNDIRTKQDISEYWANRALERIQQGRYSEAKLRVAESSKYFQTDTLLIKSTNLLNNLKTYIHTKDSSDLLVIAEDYLKASSNYNQIKQLLNKENYARFMGKESFKIYERSLTQPLHDSLDLISAKELLIKTIQTDVSNIKSKEEIPKYLLPNKQIGLRIGIGALGLASAGVVLIFNQTWKQMLLKTDRLSQELNSEYNFTKQLELEASLEDLNTYKKNEVYRNVAIGIGIGAIIAEAYLFKRYYNKKKAILLSPKNDGLGLKYNF